jgi:SPP1 gp7 family putative phage head morphogenesis protein
MLVSLVEKIRLMAKEEISINGKEIINQANLTFMRSDAVSTGIGWGKMLNDLIERIAFGITETLIAILNKIAEIALNTNDLHKRDFIRQVNQAYGRVPNVNDGRLIGQIPRLMADNPLAVNILNNEPALPSLLSAWEQYNLSLIKSIPDGVIGQLRSEFTRAFVNGTNMEDLAKIVEGRAGVGKNRAKLIARDQIGKLNGQLSEMRQKAAGIDDYVWHTMQDERVRPTHRVRNNKRYSWNDSGIKPGQEIKCRCVASPVFPEL